MRPFVAILLFLQLTCCHTETGKPANSQELPVIAEEHLSPDTIMFSKVKSGSGLKFPWIYEWNYFISSELLKYKEIFIGNDSLYKNDILKLCPGYYNLSENNKVAVWTLLVASIARFESNFDPDCRFKENASLNFVYSEGLLQLSYGDETRYKKVPLDPEKKNILNPEVNLRTGVVILSRQLALRKSIFTGKHFYWSVLTNKQNEIIKFFQDNIAELNICN